MILAFIHSFVQPAFIHSYIHSLLNSFTPAFIQPAFIHSLLRSFSLHSFTPAFIHPAFSPDLGQAQCHSSAGHLIWRITHFLDGYGVPHVRWTL